MKVAAVDIGTNTVRLLVANRDPGSPALTPLRRLATVTRLGQRVDSDRRLHPAALTRTIAVLKRYRRIIEMDAVGMVDAVATSAVRDASNREVFLDVAGSALGVRPRVISGEEEAQMSFRGVSSGVFGDLPLLVIDPGGGSTEFVMGEAEPGYAISIDTGSVRVTERHLPRHPAPQRDVDAACAGIDVLLEAVDLPARPGSVAGVGATFTSLAAIMLDLGEYDAARIHGASFPAPAFAGMVERLAGLTVVETAAIPSLDPDRAPVLLGGAIVAFRALARVGASEVVVSEADILDGVALTMRLA